jgi:DNA repair exonuclease SbcCD nuclease subunit
MKVAVLGDTHFGARNDNQAFHDYFEKFYSNVFFPTLKERGISKIVQLGDLFDRRKYVNFYTLKRSREYFFDQLVINNLHMDVFVGNHDTYFKNTNDVNSPDLLLQDYIGFVRVYSDPADIDLDDLKVTLLPWVCSGNYEQCMEHIRNTDSQILFGHLELAGFEMHRGAVNDHGMDVKPFDKFDIVMSGHYHHKSSRGNIHYLGTPYEMTWSDYDDPKGFHIFDTETRELEFIRNPYTMFQKWFYNDIEANPLELNESFDSAAGAIVKVVVKNKTNPYWFDMYITALEKAGAIDIQVVDDHLNLQLEDDDDIIDEAEDTLTILKNYANSISTNVETADLNKFFSELYSEALTVE